MIVSNTISVADLCPLCNENHRRAILKVMKRFLFLLIIPLCFFGVVKAQDAEKDAVKRVVETYLFSEDDEERKQILYEQAKIYSTNAENNKIEEKRFTAAKKKPKGTKIVSLQKIVNIEIAEDAALVKVETDLSSGENKFPKHFQYISLLKAGGAWKIVSILMPKIKLSRH